MYKKKQANQKRETKKKRETEQSRRGDGEGKEGRKEEIE